MGFLKVDIHPKRIYGLDILRGAAILVVVFAHGKGILPAFFDDIVIYISILPAVVIFYVLSGFLIGNILIKILESGKPSFRIMLHFWIRRWFRTLPNYFLVLLISALVFSMYIDLPDLWKYFFYLQNFNSPHPNFFQESWSLSVEEWFYLITPLSIFGLVTLGFKNKKAILITSAVIIITSTLLRYFRFPEGSVNSLIEADILIRKQVINRLDNMMYGILGAFVLNYFNHFFHKYKSLNFKIGLVLLIITYFLFLNIDTLFLRFYYFYTVFYLMLTAIGVLFIMPMMYSVKTGKGWVFRILTKASIISYSIYLINLTPIRILLLPIVLSYFPQSDSIYYKFLHYFLYWFFTIGGAFLLYKIWELPMTNVRERFNFLIRKK